MSEGLIDKINETLTGKKFGKLHIPIDFNTYLELVQKNPSIIKTSFQRLHSMILSFGSEQIDEKKHYNLFDDPFYDGKYALYGIDDTISNLVNCIKAGADGFPIKDRILLFKGPPATGKSTITKLLKKGLEEYTKTDEGAIYSFFWKYSDKVIACPIHEEPLRLIPFEHRKEIFKKLGIKADIGGDLCPVCYEQYQSLLQNCSGDWKKLLDYIKIYRIIFSEKRKEGIGTVYQKGSREGMKDYIGMVNQELAKSNLGLIEFVDLFKTEYPFSILLEASQSHKIEFKDEEIELDTVILATTNNPDYNDVLSRDKHKTAFKDRIIEIETPHALSVKEEERIYKKDFDFKKGSGHLDPHLLKMAATFAVLTRFDERVENKGVLFNKMKFYDKEKINVSEDEINRYKFNSKRESSKEEAISPREMQNILSRLTTSERFEKTRCIDTFALFNEIEKTIQESAERFEVPKKNEYIDKLKLVKSYIYPQEYYDEICDIIVGGEEAVEKLFNEYIEHIKSYTIDEKMKNKFTGETEDPSEKFMISIESRLNDARSTYPSELREKIIDEIGTYHKGGKFNYKSYSGSDQKEKYTVLSKVVEAIKKKLFVENSEDIIKKLKLMKDNTLSGEDQKRVDEIKDKLIKNFGYCPHCATLVLSEYVNNFI